ncbi:MAG: prepilin-type N-terminal cleavage/methylation domain-containing protein [Candidatus Omnitrophica bacterium]|nr:prepilin-type N-terminal cleavage/methylation domain-containing protein [Candidatus Omnitrophota bacterium]
MDVDQRKKYFAEIALIRTRGFTVLELIIVVVIVGVLTSLAMPKMFLMIERTRIVEGVGLLMEMRSYLDRCYLMNNQDYAPCSNVRTTSDLTAMAQTPNSHFFYGGYEITVVPTSSEAYVLTVFRNSYELGVPDPGGYSGCTVVTSRPNSSLTLCVNQVDDNNIYIKGGGLYKGYTTDAGH